MKISSGLPGAQAVSSPMPSFTVIAVAACLLLSGTTSAGQTRMKPAEPGTKGDPVWQGTLRAPDGRTFVTDGGLVIEAAFAKPTTLPSRQLPPKVLQDYFSLPHTVEYGFGDFTRAATGKTYTTPNGIAVNATYVDFLRRVLPRAARVRVGTASQPVLVFQDGKPVAAFMPVAQ